MLVLRGGLAVDQRLDTFAKDRMSAILQLSHACELFEWTIRRLNESDYGLQIIGMNPLKDGQQYIIQYEGDVAIANLYFDEAGIHYSYQGTNNSALALLQTYFPAG